MFVWNSRTKYIPIVLAIWLLACNSIDYAQSENAPTIIPIPSSRLVCEIPIIGSNLLKRSPSMRLVKVENLNAGLNQRIAVLLESKDKKRLKKLRKIKRHVSKCHRRRPPYVPGISAPPIPSTPPDVSNAIPTPSGSENGTPSPDSFPTPEGTISVTPTATPTLYIPESRIRPFVSFLWGSGSPNSNALPSAEERNKFYRVMHSHYSTAPTGPSSAGHFEYLKSYRRDVLSINPQVNLGVYMSAVTSTNPVDISNYNYPRSLYVDDDNNPATPERFRCAMPQYIYNRSYVTSRRPDSHAFFDDGSGNYQPLLLSGRTSSQWEPWGTGVFGWWPFEHLLSRGLISQATSLYCRPTIRFDLPETASFVSSALLRLLKETPQFEAASMATFDNASMVTRGGFWPGKGEAGSRYEFNPPDDEFAAYLMSVKNTLNAAQLSLAINTGYNSSASLAGSADIAFFEYHGISRDTSSLEFASILDHYRRFMRAGTAVVPFYMRGPLGFTNQHQETLYFIGSSMLVYEEGQFSFVPLMHSQDMPGYTEDNRLRFIARYFYIPSCLGDPLGDFAISSAAPALYFREFRNGIVMVNASSQRIVIPQSARSEWRLDESRFPNVMAAKSAAVFMRHCNCLETLDSGFEQQCRQWYSSVPEPEPLRHWDLNCDEQVDRADGDAFSLYLINPQNYAIQYPYCAEHILSIADWNGDGVVNQIDYQRFYQEVIRAGSTCGDGLAGDTNCDGCIDNGDIDSFLLALNSPEQYTARYPGCPLSSADIDGDGDIDQEDADLLVAMIGMP